MDMIERVATAIVESIKAQLDGHPIPGVPPSAESWTASGGTIDGNALARAAIEAMMEPTPEMEAAGERALYDEDHRAYHLSRAAYDAYVDAALTPPQP